MSDVSIAGTTNPVLKVDNEIAGASAIIVRRSGDHKPGEWVQDKDAVFIGTFDLVDAYGSSLGIKTDWYDAAIELGKPKTFNDTVNAVANSNTKGRGGLRLNPARYEAELFEKLKSGEAIGKHVIAPLDVVNGIYELRNEGEYKRRSEGNLPGKLITTYCGTGDAHWQWSCTPLRNIPDGVRAVDFTDGFVDWLCRDGCRLSGRACFAGFAL
jgi:hypothetical protein